MSEKRLSFIIDPGKAKTGAEAIKQSLRGIASEADKVKDALKLATVTTERLQTGLTGSSKGMDATTRAARNLDNAIASNNAQLSLYKKGLMQASVAQKAEISLQRQLAQSQAKLSQTYTKEYAELIRNNEAIKKRRRELLGLDQVQKKTSLSADRLRSSALALGGAFGAFSFGYLATEAVRVADAYTGIQNRLAVVTDGTVDLTQATRELLDVSIRSRTELDSTMDVYSKLIRVTKNMSVSNNELLRITESVSKAVAMSGSSAQGAQGALLQFSQALSGDFQASAQELNSIIEQTPAVAQLMADALNRVDSSMNATLGNLKRLAQEGRISTEMLLEGILLMSDTIDNQFNNSMRTVSQSMVAFRDAFTVAFGEMDKAFGGTGSIAETITEMARAMGDFKAELTGVVAGLGAFVAAVSAAGLYALAGILGTAALAVGSLATAFGVAVAAIVKYNADIALAESRTRAEAEAVENLKLRVQALKTAYDEMGAAALQSAFEKEYGALLQTQIEIQELRERIESETIYTPSGDFVRITQEGKELQRTLEVVNQKFIEQNKIVQELKSRTENIWDDLQTEQQRVRTVKDVVAALGEEVNAQQIATRQLAEKTLLMRAFAVAQEQGVEITTEFVKAVLQEAELIKALTKETTASQKATRDWQSDLDSLRKSLDPTFAALRDKQDAMEILNKTVLQGTPLYNELSTAIKERYTKAVREAKDETIELLEPIENIYNSILGLQPAYDSYNQMVTRIVNSNAAEAEKVRLVNNEYQKLQETLSKTMEGTVAPDVAGMPEQNKFEQDTLRLNEWHTLEMEMIRQQQEAKLLSEEEYLLRKNEIQSAYQERQVALNNAMLANELSTYSILFSEMSGLAGAFAGEQSSAYRALFAIQKGFAVASVIMNNAAALSAAWASAPFPANLPAVALTAAKTGVLSSIVQNVAMPIAMAHDGIDSVPREGTWLLDKGERVYTNDQARKVDAVFDRVATSGGASGEGVVVQVIDQRSNGAPVEREEYMDAEGVRRVRLIVKDAMRGAFANGEMDPVMAQNYGLSRKGTRR